MSVLTVPHTVDRKHELARCVVHSREFCMENLATRRPLYPNLHGPLYHAWVTVSAWRDTHTRALLEDHRRGRHDELLPATLAVVFTTCLRFPV